MTVREQKVEFVRMKELFQNTCVRCEGSSGLVNVERDHIKPTYQGGINEPTNWQPICARCNASKGAESIDHRISFAANRGIVIPEKWLKNKLNG
jgi:5-methylcytosine-specific restriction endonuclease McrA